MHTDALLCPFPDNEYLPNAQSVHVDCLVAFWYFPCSHVVHEAFSFSAWYLPSAQDIHDVVAVAFWYCPLEQILHATCLVSSWYLPCSHVVHESFPFSCWYSPSTHDIHDVVAVAGWYCPLEHCLHESSVFPAFSSYVPLAQSSHPLDVYILLCLPLGQFGATHFACPAMLCDPRTHCAQVAWPVLS